MAGLTLKPRPAQPRSAPRSAHWTPLMRAGRKLTCCNSDVGPNTGRGGSHPAPALRLPASAERWPGSLASQSSARLRRHLRPGGHLPSSPYIRIHSSGERAVAKGLACISGYNFIADCCALKTWRHSHLFGASVNEDRSVLRLLACPLWRQTY